MNLFGDKRKLYILAGALLVLVVAVCGAWTVWNRALPAQAPQEAQLPAENAGALTDGEDGSAPDGEPVQSAETINTIVYYQDNYGYLVPVMRTVPAAEGIAKATLGMMVQSPYNDMEAARLGLRTIFPEGTEMSLDISDGVAKIDLGRQVMKLKDAQSEANMVDAVVQTLTEFPTVNSVQFSVNGERIDQLTNGTEIAGDHTRRELNLESVSSGLALEDAKTVQLYFPGETSSLIVPVTRMVYGAGDIETAVLELTKGPSATSPLDSALPSGCGLIGVNIVEGKAVINFTREFVNIAEQTDGGRMALKALVLTCTQFEGVDGVEIQVEGEHYDPGASTLAIPTFVNEASAIQEQSIRTQAAMILDID